MDGEVIVISPHYRTSHLHIINHHISTSSTITSPHHQPHPLNQQTVQLLTHTILYKATEERPHSPFPTPATCTTGPGRTRRCSRPRSCRPFPSTSPRDSEEPAFGAPSVASSPAGRSGNSAPYQRTSLARRSPKGARSCRRRAFSRTSRDR